MKRKKVKDRCRRFVIQKVTKSKIIPIKYDDVWKMILRRKRNTQNKLYLGAFVDWDNSPRRGKRGTVFTGANPEKFEKYLRKQVQNCVKYDSEFLFINAWNEWAEGAYLEPDVKNNYKYLESIQKILNEEK